MLDNIDAVFLDAGGVLLRPDVFRIKALFPELELDEEMIDRALYPSESHAGAGLAPGDDDNQFVHEFAIACGIPETALDEEREKEMQNIMLFSPWIARKITETKRFIEYIKSTGRKIVIVTNTENGLAKNVLRGAYVCTEGENDCGISTVDKIVDTWLVGIHKPDPAIYTYTADLINVDIKRCLHIGDSFRNDYEAGMKAGAKVLLFRPYEKRSETTICSLLDVLPDEAVS
ncbi:putative hydrolase of the HAD superfamily [Ruminococcus flavefaciens]|uniref:Putative hydrolase of the HAD superfamily n=2 Tax=Oscillospiraceae TaxID=216572 RepID=A0A1M7GD50_RUMFL|nr:HAD family hydrolase [Ruminococcus sp.]SHM13877.1 putative hydrolase of the HAD superfamily [Ruminococcus flavefaciens]